MMWQFNQQKPEPKPSPPREEEKPSKGVGWGRRYIPEFVLEDNPDRELPIEV